MSDPFHTSLINSTSPVPWDQAMIISQYVLNEQFLNMWKVAKKGSPLLHCNYTDRGWGTIDGDLAAPVIEIHVEDTSFNFWYTMSFLKGTANVYISNQGNQQAQLDLTGFKLKFQTTQLATDKLDKDDDQYTEYFKNTNIQIPQSAVFSLYRLFIQAIDASLIDKKNTVYGKYGDWTQWSSTQPADVQMGFANLINDWFTQENVSGQNLLGISLSTTQPSTVNEKAPTFPPNYVGRGLYAWLDPSVSNPSPADGLDQNAFCYLIMTGNSIPPSPPILNHSGTFVNASNTDGARLCINAQQFWTQWFLPQFVSLNQSAEIYCTKPNVHVTALKSTIAPEYYVGYNPDHQNSSDAYFNFKPASSDTTKSPLPATWNASGAGLNSSNDDKSGGGGSWDEMNMTEDGESVTLISPSTNAHWKANGVINLATTSVSVSCTPGGQEIMISGKSYFHMHVVETGFASGPFKTTSDGTVTVTWSANYALGDAPKGGLAVNPYPDPNTYFTINATDTHDDSIGWEKDWSTYTDGIESSIKTGISTGLSNVLGNLSTALNQQHQFIMPGGGNFLFDSAMFNERGDLLLSLSYNGVPRT